MLLGVLTHFAKCRNPYKYQGSISWRCLWVSNLSVFHRSAKKKAACAYTPWICIVTWFIFIVRSLIFKKNEMETCAVTTKSVRKPGSYFLLMRLCEANLTWIWRHNPPFAAELNATQLSANFVANLWREHSYRIRRKYEPGFSQLYEIEPLPTNTCRLFCSLSAVRNYIVELHKHLCTLEILISLMTYSFPSVLDTTSKAFPNDPSPIFFFLVYLSIMTSN